jgi:tRNA 2-thiouridine synthesizing protein A
VRVGGCYVGKLTSFIMFSEDYSLTKELVGLPKGLKPNRMLDCLGLFCPEPVFQTRMEIDKLQIGETLEVLADDPAAEEDIKRLTKALDQELVEFKKEDGKLRFLIKRIK